MALASRCQAALSGRKAIGLLYSIMTMITCFGSDADWPCEVAQQALHSSFNGTDNTPDVLADRQNCCCFWCTRRFRRNSNSISGNRSHINTNLLVQQPPLPLAIPLPTLFSVKLHPADTATLTDPHVTCSTKTWYCTVQTTARLC